MDIPYQSFESILMRIILWVEMQARNVLDEGRALNGPEVQLALRAGVQHPEEILLLPVAALPTPGPGDIKNAVLNFGLITPDTEGLTIGYNIFLLENRVSDLPLAYQLAKVAQCERCEGIPGFLTKYLQEIQKYGLLMAPMELEARAFVANEFSLHQLEQATTVVDADPAENGRPAGQCACESAGCAAKLPVPPQLETGP